MNPLRLILMGTGPFAVPSFEAISARMDTVELVITRPPRAVKSRKGPPPAPVHQWAIDQGHALQSPESINDPEVIEQLLGLSADLLVVCDYGQILSKEALGIGRLGGINLHGSLLPAYRGAAPVQRALLAGEQETGVSVIHMTPRLDGGPVLTSRSTSIDDNETAGQLEERLSAIGVQPTLDAIDQLREIGSLDTVIGEPQDATKTSRAPRLSKPEGRIDWSREVREIDCHVRGMQPWPVAFCEFPRVDGKPPTRVMIRQVVPLPGTTCDPAQAGCRLSTDEPTELVIGCADGQLAIKRLQPAGKKEMNAADFLRGNQIPVGTKLL